MLRNIYYLQPLIIAFAGCILHWMRHTFNLFRYLILSLWRECVNIIIRFGNAIKCYCARVCPFSCFLISYFYIEKTYILSPVANHSIIHARDWLIAFVCLLTLGPCSHGERNSLLGKTSTLLCSEFVFQPKTVPAYNFNIQKCLR